ncbi:MAG: hypothetical protein MJ092_02515 [Lachnospiraceae bacterium]|nr:hypothetical protein [Lachnospiraceae bacterium]
MDKKTKDSLLNIAAELVVSPLRVYASVKELKEKLDADGTHDKIKAYVNDFGAKAKEFGEDAKKFGDDLSAKVKEFADGIDGKPEEEDAMDDDLDAIILDAVNKEDSEEEE